MRDNGNPTPATMRWLPLGLVLPALLVGAWFLAANRTGDAFLLPGPSQVGTALYDLWREGRLLRDLGASLGRVGLGFALASVLGVPLGFAAGRAAGFARLIGSTLDFLRQIPPVALVPLLILWLGLGEAPKLLVIIYAAFFPIFLAAELGARQVDRNLLEVGLLYQRRRSVILRQIVIPSALPSVTAGLRLGLGYGWRSLVVAEMLAAARGLGALIVEARSFGQADRMLAGVLAVGAAGLILDQGLRACERLWPWARGTRGTVA